MEDFVQANGVTVHYKDEGARDGRSVLLLHGWGARIESFRPLLDDLSTDLRVVAIDFPGHGASGHIPAGGWNVSDFTACVLSLMDQLDLKTTSILGHSFGARVAIKIAVVQPHRVARLILVDGAGVPPDYSINFLWRKVLSKAGLLTKRSSGRGRWRDWVYRIVKIDDYIDTKDGDDLSSLKDTYLKVISEDLTSLLQRIDMPSLLIWGDQDKDTPPASAYKIKKLMPQSELIILKGAGHFSYLDRFPIFRLLVRAFLSDSSNGPELNRARQ